MHVDSATIPGYLQRHGHNYRASLMSANVLPFAEAIRRKPIPSSENHVLKKTL
jgi:hypothetical protein